LIAKKTKKRVLVVLGGKSRERKVSIESGKACFNAIKKIGHKVKIFDSGKKHLNLINKGEVDIIFNALHGTEGEDGLAQSYFEYLRIPYTHSGVISSMNAMDKVISKKIFIQNKVLTPKFFVLKKEIFSIKILKKKISVLKLKFPIVVKPVSEGSSIGVEIIKNLNSLYIKTKFLFKTYDELIFEDFIGGQEIQVAILNGRALGAIELKPKRKFYDYKAKYSKSAMTNHIMPAGIKRDQYNKVLKIAKKVHKIFNCRGVTRSDFKFFKGKFYLLEINTQPGMTSLSLVPEIANFKNISFNKLVDEILKDASINK
jgi:D-alanine-D-alanine ligase